MRLDDIEMSEEIAIDVIKRFMDNPYFDNVLRKALSLSLDALAERVNKSDRGIHTEKLIEVSVTNGDVIKTLFPKLECVEKRGDTKSYLLEPDNMLSPKLGSFNSWWDEPYIEPYNAESEE